MYLCSTLLDHSYCVCYIGWTVFRSNEEDVLREMNGFIATLPE